MFYLKVNMINTLRVVLCATCCTIIFNSCVHSMNKIDHEFVKELDQRISNTEDIVIVTQDEIDRYESITGKKLISENDKEVSNGNKGISENNKEVLNNDINTTSEQKSKEERKDITNQEDKLTDEEFVKEIKQRISNTECTVIVTQDEIDRYESITGKKLISENDKKVLEDNKETLEDKKEVSEK